MSIRERDSPFGLLWLLSTCAIWLIAFFALANDHTGDGQFTVSDVSLAAREATVGWVEREAASRPCEARSSVERFFETNQCKWLNDLKWPLGLFGFAAVGALLGGLLSVLLGLWWRLTD